MIRADMTQLGFALVDLAVEHIDQRETHNQRVGGSGISSRARSYSVTPFRFPFTLLVASSLTLATAIPSWHIVERPILRLKSRSLARAKQPAT
jgi:hypothetical protein